MLKTTLDSMLEWLWLLGVVCGQRPERLPFLHMGSCLFKESAILRFHVWPSTHTKYERDPSASVTEP